MLTVVSVVFPANEHVYQSMLENAHEHESDLFKYHGCQDENVAPAKRYESLEFREVVAFDEW